MRLKCDSDREPGGFIKGWTVPLTGGDLWPAPRIPSDEFIHGGMNRNRKWPHADVHVSSGGLWTEIIRQCLSPLSVLYRQPLDKLINYQDDVKDSEFSIIKCVWSCSSLTVMNYGYILTPQTWCCSVWAWPVSHMGVWTRSEQVQVCRHVKLNTDSFR